MGPSQGTRSLASEGAWPSLGGLGRRRRRLLCALTSFTLGMVRMIPGIS